MASQREREHRRQACARLEVDGVLLRLRAPWPTSGNKHVPWVKTATWFRRSFKGDGARMIDTRHCVSKKYLP